MVPVRCIPLYDCFLLIATYKILKISSNFKNSKTKMCFRPFWATLIFWHPTPPPNGITPDLAWYKFGPIFFNKKLFSPKSLQNLKIFGAKCILGDSKQLTFYKKNSYFKIHPIFVIFKPEWDSADSKQLALYISIYLSIWTDRASPLFCETLYRLVYGYLMSWICDGVVKMVLIAIAWKGGSTFRLYSLHLSSQCSCHSTRSVMVLTE